LTPFYLVTKLDPKAILYFLYAYNILFTLVALFVLSKIFSRKLALLTTAILGIVPYVASMDTVSWNPILIPLVLMSFLYLLYKYELSRKVKWLFFSFACYSLGISFHVQFTIYGLFFLPLFYKNRFRIRDVFLIVFGFILPFLPLVLFDVRHGLINLKLFIGMIGGLSVRDIFQILSVWSNFLTMVFNVTFLNIAGIFFYLFLVLLLGVYMYVTKKWRHSIWIGMFLIWIAFPFAFLIYGKRPSEYYFNFLIPLMAIFVSSVIADLISSRQLFVKTSGVALLMMIFLHFFPKTMDNIRYISPKSYYNKDKTVLFIKSLITDSPPFGLSYSVSLGEDVGFRYMMDYHKIIYSKKSSDTLMQITYPADYKNDTFTTGVYGLKIPDTWLNESLQLK